MTTCAHDTHATTAQALPLLLLLVVTLDGLLRCIALPSCRTLWQRRLCEADDDDDDNAATPGGALVHVRRSDDNEHDDDDDVDKATASRLCDVRRWHVQWPHAQSSGGSSDDATTPQWCWQMHAHDDAVAKRLSCRDAVAHVMRAHHTRAYCLRTRRERYVELSLRRGTLLYDTAHNNNNNNNNNDSRHADDDDSAVLCMTVAHDTTRIVQARPSQRHDHHKQQQQQQRRHDASSLQLHSTHVTHMHLVVRDGDSDDSVRVCADDKDDDAAVVVCLVHGDVYMRDGRDDAHTRMVRVGTTSTTTSTDDDDNINDDGGGVVVVAAYSVTVAARHSSSSASRDNDKHNAHYTLRRLRVRLSCTDADDTDACASSTETTTYMRRQDTATTTTTSTQELPSPLPPLQRRRRRRSHDAHRITTVDDADINNNDNDDNNDDSDSDAAASSGPWLAVPQPVTAGAALTSFFDDHYEPLRVLGSGASGAVLLVRHRVTGVFYAVKVLVVRDYASERAVLQEVRLHSVLEHRFLVRYHASWSEVVTPRRAQQLAMIGLCHPREAGIAEAAASASLSSSSSSLYVRRVYDTTASDDDTDEQTASHRGAFVMLHTDDDNSDNSGDDDVVRGAALWGSLPRGRVHRQSPQPPRRHGGDKGSHGNDTSSGNSADGGGSVAMQTSTTASTPRVRVVGDNVDDAHTQQTTMTLLSSTSSSLQQRRRRRRAPPLPARQSQQPPPPRSIVGARVVFLQMEYCQTTLKDYLATRDRVDRITNLTIVLQLMAALRYMHRMGVLHRDLKATNVFLSFRCQLLPPGVLDSDDSSSSDSSDDDDDGSKQDTTATTTTSSRAHTSDDTHGARRLRRRRSHNNNNNSSSVYSGALMPMTSSALFTPYGVRFGLGDHHSNHHHYPGATMHYADERHDSSSSSHNNNDSNSDDGSVDALLLPPPRSSDEMLRVGGALWAERLRRSAAAGSTQARKQRAQLLPPLAHMRPSGDTSGGSCAGDGGGVVSTTPTTAVSEHVAQHVVRWLRHSLVQARLGDFGLAKNIHTGHAAQQQQQQASAASPVTELVDDDDSDDDSTARDRHTTALANTVGVGTPLYASPEQLRGDVCSGASDAFALGVLLAEMYLQPSTASERIVRLQQVRNGVFPDDDAVCALPELAVVRALTRAVPSTRMRLGRARAYLHHILLDCVRHALSATTTAATTDGDTS